MKTIARAIVTVGASLAIGTASQAATLIPHPNPILLDPVGSRLTPEQERLIEGRWCRRAPLWADERLTKSPPYAAQEMRFRRKHGSVFNRYIYTAGFSITALKPQDAWMNETHEPDSSSQDVQITIDDDGLFVVSVNKRVTHPEWSTEDNKLYRDWYAIRSGTMTLEYQEYQAAYRGAGQPKYWIVWDPEVGAFGAPYAQAGLQKGLDEVAADNRSACHLRGGQKCVSAGGCINRPTGVAVPEDRSWAFVACGASASEAVAAAKSLCELKTGCHCEAEDASRLDFNSWFLPLK